MPPTPFTPEDYIILVNQVYFASIALSLIAVVIGAFCLQWISAFSRLSDLNYKPDEPAYSLAMRQLRYEGMVGWGVHHAPGLLLLLVQVSIGLFMAGLLIFLWNISHRVALPALVITSTGGFLLSVANALPSLQRTLASFFKKFRTYPQCPYKSPASWLVKSLYDFVLFIFKPCLMPCLGQIKTKQFRIPKFTWPFTDFSWKKHDSICAELLGGTGGRTSRGHIALGFVSASQSFAYQDKSLSTIFGGIEALQKALPNSDGWQEFTHKDHRTFSSGEEDLLDRRLFWANMPKKFDTDERKTKYALQMKNDFLTALTLQHLTRDNLTLTGICFHYRVELYIRIKNSCTFIGYEPDFGNSLDCPIQYDDDVSKLDNSGFKFHLKI